MRILVDSYEGFRRAYKRGAYIRGGGGEGAITGRKKLFEDKLDSNADQNTI